MYSCANNKYKCTYSDCCSRRCANSQCRDDRQSFRNSRNIQSCMNYKNHISNLKMKRNEHENIEDKYYVPDSKNNKYSHLNCCNESYYVNCHNCSCISSSSSSSCCNNNNNRINFNGRNSKRANFFDANKQDRYSQTRNNYSDLAGYLIFVTSNHNGEIKVYGSSADKSDLQISDEILEINGENVSDHNHTQIISYIHDCIRSRIITLKVKRSLKTNELVLNDNLKEAYIIGVDEKAKERLNRLTKSNKVTPIDIENISNRVKHTSSSKINNNSNKLTNKRPSTIHELDNEIDYQSPYIKPILKNLSSKKSLTNSIESGSCSSGSSSSSSSFKSSKSVDLSRMVKHTTDSLVMSTFSTSLNSHLQHQTKSSPISKRPAPLAPESVVKIKDHQIKKNIELPTQASAIYSSTKSNKSAFSSLSSSASNHSGLYPNNPNIQLTSSSSSSSSSTKSFKSSSAASSIKDKNLCIPQSAAVSANNYCSTSSVSSDGSVLSSSSPPPSPPSIDSKLVTTKDKLVNSPGYYKNMAFESDLVVMLNDESCDVGIDDVIDNEMMMVEYNSREMAIDCPDNFVPEIKTKPCYPPPPTTHNTPTNQSLLQATSNKNILKPLLSIINKDETPNQTSTFKKNTKIKKAQPVANLSSSSSLSFNAPSSGNTSQCELIQKNEPVQTEKNKPVEQHLSSFHGSSPSIKFIDDDAKSRASLIHNNLLTELSNQQQKQHDGLISSGKKLFDKQRLIFDSDIEVEMRNKRQKEEQFLRDSLRNSHKLKMLSNNKVNEIFMSGTVNNGFEMDDENDTKFESQNRQEEPKKDIRSSLVRPPTPPPRADKALTCFSITDETNLININIDNNNLNTKIDTNLETGFECLSNVNLLSSSSCASSTASSSKSTTSTVSSKLSTSTSTTKQDTQHKEEINKNLDIDDFCKHIDLIQKNLEKQLKLKSSNLSAIGISEVKIEDDYLIREEGFKLDLQEEIAKAENFKYDDDDNGDDDNDETKINDSNKYNKIFSACNQDINLINNIWQSKKFKDTVLLYNKILKLISTMNLKPITNNLTQITNEIMKYIEARPCEQVDISALDETTNELCNLLARLDLQNLFSAHDQISTRYEEQKVEQQKINEAIMIEQQHQFLDKQIEINNLDVCDAPTVVPGCDIGIVDDDENDNDDDCHNLIVEDSNMCSEQQILDTNNELSEEGRFLISKAKHYSVDNLKLVNIEKPDAPLGATIRNRDGSIVIGRIVVGGAAEQSGLLHEDDEILEINNTPVRGKTINDVCDMLCNLQGMVSFLIIPNMNYEPTKITIESEILNEKSSKMLHIRALFNYNPQEDLYIPCKELGLSFSKADIIHIISQEDDDWWQAYKDEDKDQSLAGLIPSQSFQEKRCSQMQAIIGDSFMNRKKREKGFCIRGINKNKRRRMFDGLNPYSDEILTYEEVTLYRPPVNRKRPIVLIGPHSIGRHELRKRLMQSNPSLFEVAVPHTTRQPRKDEIDGKDYHFLPRHIFEADIKQGRFIEHGEYEKNLYGTSREAIKKVIEHSKICVLNLYPQALKTLRSSDLMPYVIYIGPPNLSKLKELKNKLNENYRENDLLDIIDKGREIEELYGHYFDKIIRNTDMDKTYQELYDTIIKVQSEENWVPTAWLNR